MNSPEATGYQKLAEVEARVGEELAAREAGRVAEEAIMARLVSPEAQRLNDAAEIAIYGTGGRTEGYVDLAGQPLTEPIKGTLQEIRENPRAGTTEAERGIVAENYKADVEELVEEGFELAQAKLIMDKRSERDEVRQSQMKLMNKLIKQYMDNDSSVSAAEAEARAMERMAKRIVNEKTADQEVKDLIRSNGILTPEEYESVANGDIADGPEPDDAPTKKMPTPEADQSALEEMKKLKEINDRVETARGYYAWIKANRARGAYNPVGRFRKKNLKEARAALEKFTQEQFAQEQKILAARGVSEEDLVKHAAAFAVRDAEELAQTVYTERLQATGRYRLYGEDSIAKIKTHPSILGAKASKLYRWAENQVGVDQLPASPTVFLVPDGGLILGNPTEFVDKNGDGILPRADVDKVTREVLKQKGVIADAEGNTVSEGHTFDMPNPAILRRLKRNKPEKVSFNENEQATLKELGLDGLSNQSQVEALRRLDSAFRKNYFLALEGALSNQQLDEFARIKDAGDDAATLTWLRSAVPNQADIAKQQWDELLDTVKNGRRQFVDIIENKS